MATPAEGSPAGSRPRPAPRPDLIARATRVRGPARQIALPEPPPAAQVVAAAGTAVIAAARVGRLLGRAGWRIAKQMPVVSAVETQAQRFGQAAITEMARMLDLPGRPRVTAEEQRAMILLRDGAGDPEPLRSAMSELLERSVVSDARGGQDYLFGTMLSQLVPDEARILAALADGRPFATIDVVAKQVGRSTTRTVLANASTVGTAARVATADNVPTYLSRLNSFGLLDFSRPVDGLEAQFAELTEDPLVRAARTEAQSGKFGSARIVRKSVTLSPLGREFWAACAPTGSSSRMRGG